MQRWHRIDRLDRTNTRKLASGKTKLVIEEVAEHSVEPGKSGKMGDLLTPVVVVDWKLDNHERGQT